MRTATLLKRVTTQVFPVNIAEFMRTFVLKNVGYRLLLWWLLWDLRVFVSIILYSLLRFSDLFKILNDWFCQEQFKPATLFKKRPWCRYFPVNFAKFSSAIFVYSTSGGCREKLFVKMQWIYRRTFFQKSYFNRIVH